MHVFKSLLLFLFVSCMSYVFSVLCLAHYASSPVVLVSGSAVSFLLLPPFNYPIVEQPGMIVNRVAAQRFGVRGII